MVLKFIIKYQQTSIQKINLDNIVESFKKSTKQVCL